MPRVPGNLIEQQFGKPDDFEKFGTFEVVDSHMGSGGGAVFTLRDLNDGKYYDVSFLSIKNFLNGCRVTGTIKKGPTYNFKITA